MDPDQLTTQILLTSAYDAHAGGNGNRILLVAVGNVGLNHTGHAIQVACDNSASPRGLQISGLLNSKLVNDALQDTRRTGQRAWMRLYQPSQPHQITMWRPCVKGKLDRRRSMWCHEEKNLYWSNVSSAVPRKRLLSRRPAPQNAVMTSGQPFNWHTQAQGLGLSL
jgi:hypothetical protein